MRERSSQEVRAQSERQKALRAKMLPRSTIACVHKPPGSDGAFLRKGSDCEGLDIPRAVAQIGAWLRGNRYDYNGDALPSNKEAKNLTCAACGDHGQDVSRCAKSIMCSGSDCWEVAKGPL
jgi:hypothetical protein